MFDDFCRVSTDFPRDDLSQLQESQISTVPVLSEHTNHIIEDIDADE